MTTFLVPTNILQEQEALPRGCLLPSRGSSVSGFGPEPLPSLVRGWAGCARHATYQVGFSLALVSQNRLVILTCKLDPLFPVFPACCAMEGDQ